MDCFQKALEYLYQKALETNGLTGEVIVTKIEAEDEKEEQHTPHKDWRKEAW